jgi:hypothetical protein
MLLKFLQQLGEKIAYLFGVNRKDGFPELADIRS